ncbi:MAG: hypothetical protein DI571_06630 [Arsenicicoccus sp.]|nr:MAG: hypothetical protein DI571_06630 [Arsenicicoccus sp.]
MAATPDVECAIERNIPWTRTDLFRRPRVGRRRDAVPRFGAMPRVVTGSAPVGTSAGTVGRCATVTGIARDGTSAEIGGLIVTRIGVLVVTATAARRETGIGSVGAGESDVDVMPAGPMAGGEIAEARAQTVKAVRTCAARRVCPSRPFPRMPTPAVSTAPCAVSCAP